MQALHAKLLSAMFAGPVSKIRLLGDYHHPTRIAFVEFTSADSARAALNCSGALLGRQLPVMVSYLVSRYHASPYLLAATWDSRWTGVRDLQCNACSHIHPSLKAVHSVTGSINFDKLSQYCLQVQHQCVFLHPRHLSDRTLGMMTHLRQGAVHTDLHFLAIYILRTDLAAGLAMLEMNPILSEQMKLVAVGVCVATATRVLSLWVCRPEAGCLCVNASPSSSPGICTSS